MTDVAELLTELTRRGVTLEPRGDDLAYHPRRCVSAELREQLRQHKTELLHLLRGEVPATEPRPVAIANPAPAPEHAPYSVVIT